VWLGNANGDGALAETSIGEIKGRCNAGDTVLGYLSNKRSHGVYVLDHSALSGYRAA
jgi:hypothetical protein